MDTSSGASDTVSWGKIVFGVIFLLLAARQWRNRPAPGVMKSWLAVHNAAVMIVLFVVFGVDLIAKGLPPLTS